MTINATVHPAAKHSIRGSGVESIGIFGDTQAWRGATGEGWWMVDWPDADDHFSLGVGCLTRLDTGDPRHLRLTDERLFDYP